MSLSNSSDYKIILKNFSYLSIMRAINIGFKFFLVAYLIRVLGNQNYGLVTWLDSVIQFFLMFINFGFNVYAAKYIVDNKSNTKRINEITSSILTIKLLLFLVSFIAVYTISFSDSFDSHRPLFLLLIVCGVGEVLFPIWYFQGKENLKPATIIVFVSRLLLVIGTFFLVKTDHNTFEYVALLVFSSLLMGVLGVIYVIKTYKVRLFLVPVNRIVTYAKEAIPFFMGRFLSLVFNFGTIFLIGKFCNLDQVAGFDVCLKIVMVCVIPFEMLQQAVFPTISRTKDKKLLKKLVTSSIVYGVAIASVVFVFSNKIIIVFGGENLLSYAPILKALAVLAPFVTLTFILGTCSLVAFGYYKEYNNSLIGTSILYIVAVLMLFYFERITFWNLVYLRILSDVLMCLVRLYYSVIRKTIIVLA